MSCTSPRGSPRRVRKQYQFAMSAHPSVSRMWLISSMDRITPRKTRYLEPSPATTGPPHSTHCVPGLCVARASAVRLRLRLVVGTFPMGRAHSQTARTSRRPPRSAVNDSAAVQESVLRLFQWSSLIPPSDRCGTSLVILAPAVRPFVRGRPLGVPLLRGRFLSSLCCLPSLFPVVRLCCCPKRTPRLIGRDTSLYPVGLTSFLLSVGDEGQGTTLLLTPARLRSHAWGLCLERKRFRLREGVSGHL